MAIRLSGMNSGLDTDSIVKALVSGYTTKKEKYEKAQTKLGWKQESWKSLNTKVYSLYSNISNLRFSSAYNLKKTSVSDTTKATVTASSTAPNGTQSLKIKETAKAGSLTGAQINATSSKTTLAQLGYTGGDAQINVNTGSTTKTITLSATSTMSDVEKQLKEAGLNAQRTQVWKMTSHSQEQMLQERAHSISSELQWEHRQTEPDQTHMESMQACPVRTVAAQKPHSRI